MTPAQRKFDLDLVRSMHRMANWIEPRSMKVAGTLRIGADRIRDLSYGEPSDVQPPKTKTLPLPPDDMRDGDLPKPSPRQRRSKKNR